MRVLQFTLAILVCLFWQLPASAQVAQRMVIPPHETFTLGGGGGGGGGPSDRAVLNAACVDRYAPAPSSSTQFQRLSNASSGTVKSSGGAQMNLEEAFAGGWLEFSGTNSWTSVAIQLGEAAPVGETIEITITEPMIVSPLSSMPVADLTGDIEWLSTIFASNQIPRLNARFPNAVTEFDIP